MKSVGKKLNIVSNKNFEDNFFISTNPKEKLENCLYFRKFLADSPSFCRKQLLLQM